MAYVVHCFDKKGGSEIEVETKKDMIEAINHAKDHSEAKYFKIFSSEWIDHYLAGEILVNGHLDWVRVPC